MKESFKKTLNSLYQSLPAVIGVLLLIALTTTIIPKEFYRAVFSGNNFLDPLIGALLGSILAGNPITSHILGGEFLTQGVSLVAVTAFLLTWITVGVVQLPAESLMLGKKFTVVRNLMSFFTAIVVAVLTVITISLFR